MADAARQRGQLPDTRAIEAEVDKMIQAYEGREQYRRGKAKRKKRQRSFADNRAHKTAAELGYKLIKRPVESTLPKAKCPCGGGCKRCKLWARVAEMVRLRDAATNDFYFPEFAGRVLRETMRLDHGLGRYKGLSRADANRALFAELEKIADDSAIAGLGNWR